MKKFNCKNGKCLATIMDDSVITCDEIIDVEKTDFNEKNVTCKTQNFCILPAFLLITITLLIYHYIIDILLVYIVIR